MINKNAAYYIKKIVLFILTLICTTLAGSELVTAKSIFFTPDYSWTDFAAGFSYSVPFLLILTVHEFGHYFTAKYYGVEVTLPNYIPMYFPGFSIGTFGALIRIVGPIKSRKQYFDIGIAGPLAGFVVALGVLWFGFTHLPEPEYIFNIHPEYAEYGLDYADHVYENNDDVVSIEMGNNLLFGFFEKYVADPDRLPNHKEIMHYPYLFSGFLALFFTALNLIPIGQLDGGHILYGILGVKKHKQIARVLYLLFAFLAGLGLVSIQTPQEDLLLYSAAYIAFLYFAFQGLGFNRLNTLLTAVSMYVAQFLTSMLIVDVSGFPGYLLFVLLLGRFIGIKHPRTIDERPLSQGRKILGWIALVIFILCFSITPFNA